MEEGSKRQCVRFGGILGLAERIPQRDVRRLIWAHLNPCDREMVLRAHNSRRAPRSRWDYRHLANWCVRYGYVGLLQWAYEQNGRTLPWRLVSLAADSGSIPMLQWLKLHSAKTKDAPWHFRAIQFREDFLIMRFAGGARESDYVAVLQWLETEQITMILAAQRSAVRVGFMRVLQHLITHHHRGISNQYAADDAAQLGNIRALEMMDPLVSRSSSVRARALRAHQTHVVEWIDAKRT